MSGSPGHHGWRRGLAVLAGVLIVGCSMRIEPAPSPSPTATATLAPWPSPSPARESSPEDGWTEYELAADGLALALPASWHTVNVDAPVPTPERLVQGAREPGPASAVRDPDPEMRFYAFDLASVGGEDAFMTNLNILHYHLAGATTLAEFGAGNVRELGRMAQLIAPLQQAMVALPAGPALRLRYGLAVEGEGGHTLSLTQFLLVRGQEGYVLTFATTPPQLEAYTPVFERIGRSLRWLGP